MARPDLDDGWFMLAYELLPPLMMCCSRVEASIVLCEVLAQTYGRGKRKSAKLEPVKIAARTGRKREYIWKGIRELTANGVIQKLGDGTYRFEKDYEKWGTDQKKLIEKPLSQYFASYHLLAKGYEPTRAPAASGPSQGPISEKLNGIGGSGSGPSQGPISGYQEGPISGPSQGPETASPPIGELEKGEVVVVVDPEVPSATRLETASDVAPASSPATSPIPRGHDGKPLLWSMYPRDHDPAEVDRIADLCANLAGPEEDTIPGNVRRNSRSYPLWYFPYAIRQSLGLGSPGKLWAYAFAVIKGLWAQGVIDEPQEVPRDRPRVTDPFIPRIAPRPAAPSRLSRGMAAFDDPRPDTKERA